MKEMMKKVKERREGFTMAELLIVVAIIAVLVAIAIPVFNSQLEKSREATDLANLRTAYAECSAAALTETAARTTENGVTVTVDSGTKVVTCTKAVVLKQQVSGWATDGDVAGVALKEASANNTTVDKIPSSGSVTVTVKSDGSVPTFTTTV